MQKKGIINPVFVMIILVAALIGFVIITTSQTYQSFMDRFFWLAITLIIGVIVGAVTNAFGILGNRLFNIILLTFYGLIRWLFDSWGMADNRYVAMLYSPIATTFVVGYAIGTFFGKMISG